MTISAYTGLQGSGKSYEVVSEVVVNAVRAGRHIVTNLEGLNGPAIEEYILRKWKEVRTANITVVGDEQIESPLFFYHEVPAAPEAAAAIAAGKPVEPGSVEYVAVEGTVTKSGDLVIVDEAWQFWGKDKKIQPAHQNFFRKHRHYVNATSGITSDLVLISQSIRDFHADLSRVIDRTFRMRKLVELGMTNGYTVFQHERASESSRTMLQKWVKRYNKDIFALYKSHSKKPGVELAVDKRRSFFAGGRIWWRAGFVLTMCVVGLFYLYRFFTPPEDPAVTASAAKSKGKDGKGKENELMAGGTASGSGGAGAGAGAGVVAASPSKVNGHEASIEWQQVGYMTKGQSKFVAVLRAGDGRYRYVNLPEGFKLDGLDFAVTVDGKGVSGYTGSKVLGGGK
jgi:zona occludens toxin